MPWNSRNSEGVSGSSIFAWALHARICSALSSSMRATGMPDWMARMVASHAASTVGNGHTPPAMLSGMPCRRSQIFVMMPSVPSDPTISRVRS